MTVPIARPLRVACALLIAVFAASDAAFAQQTPAADTPTPPRRESPWEIEVHGGFAFDLDQTGGSGGLPTTGSVIQGMISASTFYFGDGAHLFNQNQTALNFASLLVPLDPALMASAITRETGPSIGGRVQISLSRRFAIEGSADYVSSKWVFRSSASSGIDATQAAYIPALQRTLAASTVPSSVSSVTTVFNNQATSRLMATGALVINLSSSTVNIPYVVAGGGFLFNGGTTPAATFKGGYEIGSPALLIGTDAVTLHFRQDDNAVVVLGGGGFKRRLSRHTGIRVDGRLHLYSTSLDNLVDVAPARTIASSGSPLPVINIGAVQFSSTSPLNGLSYTDAVTFKGRGLQPVITVTAGFVIKF